MGEKERTQLIINTEIGLLDILLPGVPVWKIYSSYRLGRIEKNARIFEEKVKQDSKYFEERLNNIEKDLEEELKEKIAYILCEYLFESLDKIKLEEYYVYFKAIFQNPKVDITDLRKYMEMIKNLSHRDISRLIHLKRNIDLVKEHNRPIVNKEKYGNLQSYYTEVKNDSLGILLQYGLIEENVDELSRFIHEVRRNEIEPYPKSFEKKYRISHNGESFLGMFEHLHNEISLKEKS